MIWAELHARTRPYLDSLRVDLEARRHALLVGSIDGTPVGYASATPWALHEGGELGRIDEIYVLPEALRTCPRRIPSHGLRHACGEQYVDS